STCDFFCPFFLSGSTTVAAVPQPGVVGVATSGATVNLFVVRSDFGRVSLGSGAGVQPAIVVSPLQTLIENVHLPSLVASASQAGSPSVQRTPLAPLLAVTPSHTAKQSVVAGPPPAMRASAGAAASMPARRARIGAWLMGLRVVPYQRLRNAIRPAARAQRLGCTAAAS